MFPPTFLSMMNGQREWARINDLCWHIAASGNGASSLETKTGCSRFWHPRGLLGEAMTRNLANMQSAILQVDESKFRVGYV